MVATQSAHARAGALGVALLFLIVLAPVTPVQAQAAATEVGVDQGSAYWRQGNFANGNRNTTFIDSGLGESTLIVPVVNRGAAVDNVPVYFYFRDINYRSGCAKVNLPAAGTNPTVREASFTFNTRDLPAGGHNVTIEVLPVGRPAGVAATSECTGTIERRAQGASNLVNGTTDTAPENNIANTYIVKDRYLNLNIRELRWCVGSPARRLAAECAPVYVEGGTAYNVTQPYYNDPENVAASELEYTYFEAVVEALPGDENWRVLRNYGGPNAGGPLLNPVTGTEQPHFDGFPYHFNITVRGREYNDTVLLNLSWNETTGNATIEGDYAHRARSQSFLLNGKSGYYNVTAKVDPGRTLRRPASDTTDDTDHMTAEVAAQDFTGNFSDSEFRTLSTDPYPYDGPGRIRGNVSIRNLGNLSYNSATKPIQVLVYLDNLTEASQPFRHAASAAIIGDVNQEGANLVSFEIDWDYSSTLTSAKYLPPGRHTIYAVFDSTEIRQESNESNNVISLPIYIEDSSVPRFNNTPKITKQLVGPGINAPAQIEFKPLEPFNIHINVSDEDDQLQVVANFTLNSNPNITRTFRASNGTGFSDRFVAQVDNFTYHDFANRTPGGYENWTLRVVATDSFNNTAVSTAQPFRLIPWPIHSVREADLILEPTWPTANLSYESTSFANFKVRVLPNQTGFDHREDYPNQQYYKENLRLNITVNDKTTTYNGSFWSTQTSELCDNEAQDPGPDNPLIPGGGEVTGCPSAEEPNNNTFLAQIEKRKPGGPGPGVWNYSITVKDIANLSHTVNGTLHVIDQKPQIREANLSVGAGATISPGATFRVRANVSDDDDVVDAYVNFSRALDGVYANFTLVNGTDVIVDTTTDYRLWNDTIQTGRGKMLGIGGNFTVSIHAVDGAGNWNKTEIGTLFIDDDDVPEIDAGAFGVVPGAAEIGDNVTFWAKVRDSTNVSVTLNVFRAAGSDEVLLSRTLTEALDGNFTTTLNFTTEAIHGWELVPTDSVKNVGAKKTGILTIRDNLGPKYEVRSPDVVIDGTRYGAGTPRIEVVIHDVEGVVASSVDMRVAGQPVNFQLVDAPGNIEGFLATYTVPANRAFEHLDVVEVNLTARDNSTEQLVTYHNFSFVVDDRAPSARLVSVSPSYRDQPAHVLNVSLASRFTLAAEDADSIPTEVSSIRYRISAGTTAGPETVYSGPFRISDAPGVYTGPRIYQIQFWAEDAVGNSGARTSNVTSIYVDDAAPTLIQFFPQPRSVNASFLDDRVGVNNAVIWIRTNDAPYTPQELQEIDGTWRGSLPAGRLGDTISYYLQVWDKLNNTETYGDQANPYGSFPVSNQPPTIRIASPVDGARIGRSVDMTWEASEPDGQALVFKLSVKKPGTAAFVELREITESNRRSLTIDLSNTTTYRDGEYTFRLTASDGSFVSVDEVTVTMIRSTNPLGEVNVLGELAPGEELLITAQITKAEAVVAARLYLGDTRVLGPDGKPDFPMNDDGEDGDATAGDGIFSTRVRIDDAGDYRVEIVAQYREDGVTKSETIESAATFNAKLTPDYVMSKFGPIIAIIGLLAAVGIGVAVFVVMRRR